MNNENTTNEKLASILEGAKDVNRTFAVIYSYCEHHAENEKIYNVLHMMEYILKKSDDVTRDLQYYYDNSLPAKNDEYIETLKKTGNFTNDIKKD